MSWLWNGRLLRSLEARINPDPRRLGCNGLKAHDVCTGQAVQERKCVLGKSDTINPEHRMSPNPRMVSAFSMSLQKL